MGEVRVDVGGLSRGLGGCVDVNGLLKTSTRYFTPILKDAPLRNSYLIETVLVLLVLTVDDPYTFYISVDI